MAIDEKRRGAVDSAADAAAEIGADASGKLSIFQGLG